jgi:hypothetical protein
MHCLRGHDFADYPRLPVMAQMARRLRQLQANTAMPAHCVGLAKLVHGAFVRCARWSWAHPAMTPHDPMCSHEDPRGIAFQPRTLGSDVDLDVLQSDSCSNVIYRRDAQ